MVIGFIIVPVRDKDGNKMEDKRINVNSIQEYRKWLTDKGDNGQSVIYYKTGTKIIVDATPEEIDNKINSSCKLQMVLT